MAAKKCPVCGAAVKLENLERHLRDQHPRARSELQDLLTEEERQQVQHARRAARPAISRRGLQYVGVAAVVLTVVLILAIFNPFGGVGPNVGQAAPDFTLGTTDGGTITLSSLRGSPVFLEFMDVDCSFCQSEAQDVLPTVYSNYRDQVDFLSVSANNLGASDTVARINDFRTTYQTPWTYALDSSGTTVRAYAIRFTPTTFILDRNGVITQVFVGTAPNGAASYSAALDAALTV